MDNMNQKSIFIALDERCFTILGSDFTLTSHRKHKNINFKNKKKIWLAIFSSLLLKIKFESVCTKNNYFKLLLLVVVFVRL